MKKNILKILFASAIIGFLGTPIFSGAQLGGIVSLQLSMKTEYTTANSIEGPIPVLKDMNHWLKGDSRSFKVTEFRNGTATDVTKNTDLKWTFPSGIEFLGIDNEGYAIFRNIGLLCQSSSFGCFPDSPSSQIYIQASLGGINGGIILYPSNQLIISYQSTITRSDITRNSVSKTFKVIDAFQSISSQKENVVFSLSSPPSELKLITYKISSGSSSCKSLIGCSFTKTTGEEVTFFAMVTPNAKPGTYHVFVKAIIKLETLYIPFTITIGADGNITDWIAPIAYSKVNLSNLSIQTDEPANNITQTSATLHGTGGDKIANPTLPLTAYFRYSRADISPIYCNDIYGTNMVSTEDIILGTTPTNHKACMSGAYPNCIPPASESFSQNIENLRPDTTYYYCAIISNRENIAYGGESIVKKFHTSPLRTIIETKDATRITSTSATLNGTYSAVKTVKTYFKYREEISTEEFSDWKKVGEKNHVLGSYNNLHGDFSFSLAGLKPSTKYSFMAVAEDCVKGSNNPPLCTTKDNDNPETSNSSPVSLSFVTKADSNLPGDDDGDGGTGGDDSCSNGATNYPTCTFSCPNGATNYPTCTFPSEPELDFCVTHPDDTLCATIPTPEYCLTYPKAPSCATRPPICTPLQFYDKGSGNCINKTSCNPPAVYFPPNNSCISELTCDFPKKLNKAETKCILPPTADFCETNPTDSLCLPGPGWDLNWDLGTWDGGNWNNGTWTGGFWVNGTWVGGTWVGETWINGVWTIGTWSGGTWNNGVWTGGSWKNEIGNSGTWNTDNGGLSGTWGNGIGFGTWVATLGTGGTGIVTWTGLGNGTGTWKSATGSGTWSNGTGKGGAGSGTWTNLVLGQKAIPPNDAIVRYHEGIETVFARQIMKNSLLAKKYGYIEGTNLQNFAWYLADEFAKMFGYINENRKEIRVSLPDIAAYQLLLVGNKLTVYEYYDNKIVDIRNVTTTFKEAAGYEYYFKKP
ncbi:MAG: hypothetical protein WCS88_05075 [Patescibacteria group bacterium]